MDKCEVTFAHHMAVTRIYESPRVTKPYTEEQWHQVMALGGVVDQDLLAGDVRLTMGGEPTFVAVNDRDAPEWNTDALGPTKRGFATELVQKLRAEYGAGGFLHFGQGKWYPGEQLPRWALNIYWRSDRQPVWSNPALFTDERLPTHYSSEDARRFTQTLAAKLGITDKFMQSAYEDVWYYLWRERRLPVNVDPFNSKLDDEMERARLRRVFEQKLDSVVGYVLPVKVTEDSGSSEARWTTGSWFLRDERMYLMPGDSPMGLRLPLDSLPWVSESDYPYLLEQDPSALRSELPAHGAIAARYVAGSPQAHPAGFIEALKSPSGSATSETSGKLGATPYLSGTGPAPEAARRLQATAGSISAPMAVSAQSAAQTEPAEFARLPKQ
jgi:uncharacterized protein (DUF2126 family)